MIKIWPTAFWTFLPWNLRKITYGNGSSDIWGLGSTSNHILWGTEETGIKEKEWSPRHREQNVWIPRVGDGGVEREGGWTGRLALTHIHIYTYVCVHAKLLQLCLTLCNAMDCGPPGSSVQGILQARMLEWVAMASSRGSSRPWDQTHVSYISCIGRWVLDH